MCNSAVDVALQKEFSWQITANRYPICRWSDKQWSLPPLKKCSRPIHSWSMLLFFNSAMSMNLFWKIWQTAQQEYQVIGVFECLSPLPHVSSCLLDARKASGFKPCRTPMAASCVSQHYSQKLDRNCWSFVAGKQRTDPWHGHHDWPKKTVTPAGHPKFHLNCCLEEFAAWDQVGSVKILMKLCKPNRLAALTVFVDNASQQDLSSMLVVKPNGDCLAQSDAVVFVGSSGACWGYDVGSTPMFVLFHSMSQRWDCKN